MTDHPMTQPGEGQREMTADELVAAAEKLDVIDHAITIPATWPRLILERERAAAPVAGEGLLPDEDEPYNDRPDSDLTIGEVNVRAGWWMARYQVHAALAASQPVAEETP